MKKFSFYLSLILISIYVISCDKVDDPFPENLGQSFQLDGDTEYISDPSFGFNSGTDLINFINSNSWDSAQAPSNANQQFILLEEFTGHTCIFCPDGTREIVRLDSIHKEKLIPVGIHAGNFAVPIGNYTTDFRVEPHGTFYLSTFQVAGYPTGTVNRENASVSSKDTWGPKIDTYINNTNPDVKIDLKTFYSSTANTVRAQIDIEWLSSLPEDYNLSVYIVEDNIIDWQKDGSLEIPNYNHRHVLRKVVNDTWGRALNDAIQDSTQSFQYVTSVDPTWKSQDIEVVAFIFDSDVNSYRVIQANAVYVNR